MKIAKQIGILLLVGGMLSCTSQGPTPARVVAAIPVKPALPKDEKGFDLPIPEIVHSRQVRIVGDLKTVTVGNGNGDYNLFCNTKAGNCLTPVPTKDYYVFNNNTKWKMPGAKDYVTLKWVQDWTVTYPKAENIALVPVDWSAPEELGMYGLSSWQSKESK